MALRPMAGLNPSEDEATVEACRRGDPQALERVFRMHARGIERQMLLLLGPHHDIEDLLQLTFIAAIKAFPRFRGEASVRTWLAHIAHNVAKEYLRGSDRRRRGVLQLLPSEEQERRQPAPTDHLLEGRQRLERLNEHLDRIPVKNRMAFVLHVIEGRPIEEVAALTGASRVATKSRVFLARRALLARVRKDPVLRDLVTETGGAP